MYSEIGTRGGPGGRTYVTNVIAGQGRPTRATQVILAPTSGGQGIYAPVTVYYGLRQRKLQMILSPALQLHCWRSSALFIV